ncbi:hypothetical protein CI238_03807 [Colletotrichum incanum]|uniref:Uncharacterized protein n=1 Tax=Colletotrichum incanum TaxID=1573173 RepID=A0A166M611_COLIC|nr:hypothetical protein CI238_03807 [Colletotrichum incanum]
MAGGESGPHLSPLTRPFGVFDPPPTTAARAPRAWTRAAIDEPPVAQGFDRKLPQIYHGTLANARMKIFSYGLQLITGPKSRRLHLCAARYSLCGYLMRGARRREEATTPLLALARRWWQPAQQKPDEPRALVHSSHKPGCLVFPYPSADEPHHRSRPPLQTAGGRREKPPLPMAQVALPGSGLWRATERPDVSDAPLSPHRGDDLRPDCLLADPASLLGPEPRGARLHVGWHRPSAAGLGLFWNGTEGSKLVACSRRVGDTRCCHGTVDGSSGLVENTARE